MPAFKKLQSLESLAVYFADYMYLGMCKVPFHQTLVINHPEALPIGNWLVPATNKVVYHQTETV